MKNFYYFFLVLIVGITTAIAVMAFTGPGSRRPGFENPDFWIKSGNDIYYNPVGNGNVGIGTMNPGQKLTVVGTIESTSGGIKFPDGTIQTTAGGGGSSQWTTSGSNIYYNSGNVGIGTTGPRVKLEIKGSASSESMTLGTASGVTYFTDPNGLTGLFIGTSANTGNVWMQAGRSDGTATSYNINLNPSGGNVGIGTAGPGARMEIKHNTVAAPETSGSSRTGAVTRFFSKTSYYALDIGEYGTNPYSYWLQASDPADLSTNVPIVFNPNGGNVGIGTASPGYKLEVTGGPIKATGGLIIETRTSDPASPVAGQIWLRTDL